MMSGQTKVRSNPPSAVVVSKTCVLSCGYIVQEGMEDDLNLSFTTSAKIQEHVTNTKWPNVRKYICKIITHQHITTHLVSHGL